MSTTALRRVAPVEQGRGFADRIENGRSALMTDRADGVEHRGAVRGRPGHRCDRSRERRDDDLVVRCQRREQARGGGADGVRADRHALTAVDQQREQRRFAALRDQVERLRLAVLENAKSRAVRSLTKRPFCVDDGGVDGHAADRLLPQ